MSATVSPIARAGEERARRVRGGLTEVMLLAWPVLIQTISETLMSLIDSAMVGRLGAAELGAVGFSGIWIWTAFAPLSGTASGVQTFVSRCDGAGEPRLCGAWVWQALWALLPVMMVWSAVLAFALPALFSAIGPSPALLDASRSYVLARLPGAPALVASFLLMAFFRGIGDSKTPLLVSLISVAVNTAVGYVLIFGRFGFPQLGVAGAALGITAGSWVMAALLLGAFLRRSVRSRYETQPSAPQPRQIARFLRTSAPIGGQWALDLASFAMFASIVARMGDAAMAASHAMLQMLSISFMQAVAIGVSTGTLVGRSLGAQDPAAAERSFRSGQLLVLGISALVAVLFLGAPDALIGIFSSEVDVIALARPLLALGALFQVIDAVGIVASHGLRGAGDTRWPFAVQASFAWVLRLPAVYVGAIWLQGGVFGAWAGELFYVVALGAAFVARFRAGHWRSVRI